MSFFGTLLGGAAGFMIGGPQGAMMGASLGSSLDAAGAAQGAASTQADAANRTADLQRQTYEDQTKLNAPYREAGLAAQNQLLTYLGLPGGTQGANYGKYAKDFGMSDFVTDPGYAFRLSEGQKALDRSAAARGGLISGGALKAATRYGQDMGSQEYQNAYTRYQTNRTNQLQPLGNLQTVGVNATNQQAAQAGQYGVNAGNLINAAGQSIAAGQLGSANTIGNAISTGASAYGQQTNFNNWLAKQGAGGNASTYSPGYYNYENAAGVNFLAPNTYG